MEGRSAEAVDTGEAAPTSGREAAVVDTGEAAPTSAREAADVDTGEAAPTSVREAAVVDTGEAAPTSAREASIRSVSMYGPRAAAVEERESLEMRGEANDSTRASRILDGYQEVDELAIELGAIEMREHLPRLEITRLIRNTRMDIRRFQYLIPVEISKKLLELQSDGEQHNCKQKVVEDEGINFVQDSVEEIRNIELYIDDFEQEYKKRAAEDDEVLMHLTNLQRFSVMMKRLMYNMKVFLHQKCERHYKEAISEPPSMVIPVLPPVPHFEVNNGQGKTRNEDSSSDSETSSDSCSEIDELQDMYSLDGPYWEALRAPIKVLATDEEEEDMVMDASILLGSDPEAGNHITMFDEQLTNQLAQNLGTSRDFLLNLPLVYVCNNKRCSICRTGFSDRCARLPCRHYFHVRCILQWLLKHTTCPMCRLQFPKG